MNVEFNYVFSRAKSEIDSCDACRAHIAWIEKLPLNEPSASLCCLCLWSKVVTDMFLCELPVYCVCDSTLAEVGLIVILISEMPACSTQNQLHGAVFKDSFFE